MSFLNGLPFPEASDPKFGMGVNEVLRYEQNYIMSQIMRGEITDDKPKPKSVYAHLLSGKNVYPQYHPLLQAGSEAEYAPMSPDVNDLSLMMPYKKNPTELKDMDAFFVIEAVIDIGKYET